MNENDKNIIADLQRDLAAKSDARPAIEKRAAVVAEAWLEAHYGARWSGDHLVKLRQCLVRFAEEQELVYGGYRSLIDEAIAVLTVPTLAGPMNWIERIRWLVNRAHDLELGLAGAQQERRAADGRCESAQAAAAAASAQLARLREWLEEQFRKAEKVRDPVSNVYARVRVELDRILTPAAPATGGGEHG